MLEWYLSTLCYFTLQGVVERRMELFKIINGDVFFPLKEWPLALRLCFSTKPLFDEDSFKMMLFLIGNGLAPRLAAKWVMLSQFWTEDHKKLKKRARQADFVLTNVESKKNDWFYFDLIHLRLVYLSVDFKSWETASEVEEGDEENGKKNRTTKHFPPKNGSFRSHQKSQKQWPTMSKQTARSVYSKSQRLFHFEFIERTNRHSSAIDELWITRARMEQTHFYNS